MRVGSGVILFQLAGFLTSALADFYFAKHRTVYQYISGNRTPYVYVSAGAFPCDRIFL